MNLKFASTCLLLTLMIFASPAFSHSAHTTIFHNHSGIEYFLAMCAIAGIVYHYLKS